MPAAHPHRKKTPSGQDDGGSSPEAEEEGAHRVEIHIPAVTYLKAGLWLLLAFGLYELRALVLMVAVACLIATTLDSAVRWMQEKGLKRGLALGVVLGMAALLLAAAAAWFVPTAAQQGQNFVKNLPQFQASIAQRLHAQPSLEKAVSEFFSSANTADAAKWAGNLLSMGGKALEGLSAVGIVMVLAFYLVVDGETIWKWFLAFFPAMAQRKLRQTGEGMSKIMGRYVTGQGTMSGLVMVFCFIVLTILKVPAALILAMVAGVLDILPLLGFLTAGALAFLVALSVSMNTALLVLGFYVAYHLLEAYVIMPKIYEKNLRLSTLTILISLFAGSVLAGVAGALIALPLVASYSVIESIWLKKWLGEEVPSKHQEIAEVEFGTDPAGQTSSSGARRARH